MSGGGGGGGGGSRGNGGPIPAGTKKMVQSLKEIVNCTEQEIYAALKECNMDPNEAVNRLIFQDTFHEVKSKREKKKEAKETPESGWQKVSSSSNRGVRGGTDRGGRNNTIQTTSNDNGVSHGKSVKKKENGANTVPTPVLGSGIAANYYSRRLTPVSNSDSIGSTVQSTGLSDSISLPSQPSSTFQHNWSGMQGHLSMADIVKLGRPQGKHSTTPAVTTDASQSYTSHNAVLSNALHDSTKHRHAPVSQPQTNQDFHSSQDVVLKVTESHHEPGITVSQQTSLNEWSLVDRSPPESGQVVSETSGDSSIFEPAARSTLHVDGDDLQPSPHLDDIHVSEANVNSERLTDPITSASISGIQTLTDNYGGNSCLDDGSLMNMSSYQSPKNAYECHKVEDVNGELSLASANLQQLTLHKERSVESAMSKPAVIIPDHLQVTADCSHLSFGSFGSSISGSFSGAFTSKPLRSTLGGPSVRDDPSIEHSETRESEYYDNGQLLSTSNDNSAITTGTGTGTLNYDLVSASQPEVVRDNTLDASHRLPHNSPSVSGYAFSSTAQPNAVAYAHAQSNSQMQSLAPSSSATQPYANSLPSNMLPSAAQPFRELDLPFSLVSMQSGPTKYSMSMPSISGTAFPIAEAVKPGVFSMPQSAPQNIAVPSTSSSTSSVLPQHLPLPPYSQPTLPLGHFANMIGYHPFLSQSFAYMPSAFQQPYSGSSALHQSPVALNSAGFKYTLPQFKSSISVNSVPPSATVASGYGGFGSSANIPGSFTQNPTTASASASVVYEEALGSQYKEGHHFLPLQQNENSPMWVHGAGSRTLPAVPTGTYYGFQGQNQQSVIRQGQQTLPFGALGYPNLYHSLAGISQEQQQRPSEGNLNASQGPSAQPSRIWQPSY